MSSNPQVKPNGPAAAAILAAAIGAFTLGLFVTLAEFSGDIKSFLDFSKNYGIGSGVGPLSGKVIMGILAYGISWAILGSLWRRRDVNFGRMFAISLAVLALGFALTFPPIFGLFAAE